METVTDTLKGFKDFILRGNVIDLAVAVAVGAAFTWAQAVGVVCTTMPVTPCW